jgi:hypothetical protein
MKKDKLYFLYTLLGIGLTVEGSNLQNLFYGFMAIFRSDWLPIFNHAAALGLSAFFLISIVYNGLYDNKKYSWILAFLTMTISLYVYREIAPFSLTNIDFTHTHGVVFLLSVVLPYFVAFYTEEVSKERNATRTPAQPKVVKSEFDKFDDHLTEVLTIDTKIQDMKNKMGQLGKSKEPQTMKEAVKEFAEQLTIIPTVTSTVTSNQAPTETIITPKKEVDNLDIMDVLQGQLEHEKK